MSIASWAPPKNQRIREERSVLERTAFEIEVTRTSRDGPAATANAKSAKSAKPGKVTKRANGAATLSTPAGNGRSSGSASGAAAGSVELVPTQASGAGNDRTWKVNPVVADSNAGSLDRV